MFNRYKIDGVDTPLIVYRDGDIFNLESKKFVKFYMNNSGYYTFNVVWNNILIRDFVHRIVAKAFIPNPENKPYVNHKDGNKLNNDADNLEWVTASENNLHAYSTGLRKPISGEKVHFAKYTEQMVTLACKKMQEDEISLYEIEKLTGIPHKTLCDIRMGNIWKDISKKYKFPKAHTIASRIGLDHKTNKIIKEMIYAGKTNSEIYDKIGPELKSKHLTKIMCGLRYTINRKMKQASTTIS